LGTGIKEEERDREYIENEERWRRRERERVASCVYFGPKFERQN
jgi:hypothetical protein